jgi:hypothetical protein
MEKFPSLRGGRRSLTGWIIFIEHIFYKRVIPLGLNHKNEPRFFRLPRRGIGMGLKTEHIIL